MAKTVYYSKFGGEVYGIIDGSDGDAEYERSLPAGWQKAQVTDAAAKDVNINESKFKPDEKGKFRFVGRDQ